MNDDFKYLRNLPAARTKYVNRKTTISQAERVIEKFGGVPRLCALLHAIGRPRDRTVIYRWMYSKDRGGADGVIPSTAWPDLILAARMEGIILTSQDMDPRPMSYRDWVGRDY